MWRDVTEKQPDALIAWYNLAGFYFDNQEYEKAEPAYAEVLRINPGYVNGLYNYGNTFFHLKKYDLAEQQYITALTIDPNNHDSRVNLYMALLQQRKYAEAMVQIDILMRKFPNDKNVLSKRALLPKSAISQNDGSANDVITLAQAAFCSGDYVEAIKQYSKAIVMAPENDVLYYNRGNAYFVLSLWDKALDNYNKAIGLNNSDDRYWYNRAMVNQRLGNKEDCCIDLEKAEALGNINAKTKQQEFCR